MVSIHSRSSPDTQPYLKGGVYHILAGRIFDSYTRKLIPDQVITVDRNEGIILEVQDYSTFTSRSTSASEGNAETIDLKHLTILPGFVDSHVHRTHRHLPRPTILLLIALINSVSACVLRHAMERSSYYRKHRRTLVESGCTCAANFDGRIHNCSVCEMFFFFLNQVIDESSVTSELRVQLTPISLCASVFLLLDMDKKRSSWARDTTARLVRSSVLEATVSVSLGSFETTIRRLYRAKEHTLSFAEWRRRSNWGRNCGWGRRMHQGCPQANWGGC